MLCTWRNFTMLESWKSLRLTHSKHKYVIVSCFHFRPFVLFFNFFWWGRAHGCNFVNSIWSWPPEHTDAVWRRVWRNQDESQHQEWNRNETNGFFSLGLEQIASQIEGVQVLSRFSVFLLLCSDLFWYYTLLCHVLLLTFQCFSVHLFPLSLPPVCVCVWFLN